MHCDDLVSCWQGGGRKEHDACRRILEWVNVAKKLELDLNIDLATNTADGIVNGEPSCDLPGRIDRQEWVQVDKDRADRVVCGDGVVVEYLELKGLVLKISIISDLETKVLFMTVIKYVLMSKGVTEWRRSNELQKKKECVAQVPHSRQG